MVLQAQYTSFNYHHQPGIFEPPHYHWLVQSRPTLGAASNIQVTEKIRVSLIRKGYRWAKRAEGPPTQLLMKNNFTYHIDKNTMIQTVYSIYTADRHQRWQVHKGCSNSIYLLHLLHAPATYRASTSSLCYPAMGNSTNQCTYKCHVSCYINASEINLWFCFSEKKN